MAFETWVWQGYRFELPVDWEMLQFSRDPNAGRCAFADRYRFRFEFNWHRVPAPPDFNRMMNDYRTRLAAGDSVTAIRCRIGSWYGLRVEGPEGCSSRFGRHFPETDHLIELVILWPERIDGILEQQILERFRMEEPAAGNYRRWRAFGLDLLAHPELGFERCLVKPARAEFEFARARPRARWLFRRLGLVPHWLHEPLGDWLQQRTQGAFRGAERRTVTLAGHVVELVQGAAAPGGRRWGAARAEAAAWLCPADGRCYVVERYGLLSGTPPPWKLLVCCEPFRAGEATSS